MFDDPIFRHLNLEMAKHIEKHLEHKRRIFVALDWWKQFQEMNKWTITIFSRSRKRFIMNLAKINGVICVCVHTDVTGVPFYKCEFIFRPYDPKDDAGSGPGEAVTISF